MNRIIKVNPVAFRSYQENDNVFIQVDTYDTWQETSAAITEFIGEHAQLGFTAVMVEGKHHVVISDENSECIRGLRLKNGEQVWGKAVVVSVDKLDTDVDVLSLYRAIDCVLEQEVE